MGTTKYFKSISDLHTEFIQIEKDFHTAVLGDSHKHYDVFARETIMLFDSHIDSLKTLKNDLNLIRTKADNRGTRFFKHGNIKQKLTQILSVRMIDDLKKEMKKCTQILRDTLTMGKRGLSSNDTYDKLFYDYVEQYKQKKDIAFIQLPSKS